MERIRVTKRFGGLRAMDGGRREADGQDVLEHARRRHAQRGRAVVSKRRVPRHAQVLRPRASDVVDGLQELNAVARRHQSREGLHERGEVSLQYNPVLAVDRAQPSTAGKEPTARGPGTVVSSERDSPTDIVC